MFEIGLTRGLFRYPLNGFVLGIQEGDKAPNATSQNKVFSNISTMIAETTLT